MRFASGLTRLEAIASKLEAITLRAEVISTRLEAITTRLEAIALTSSVPLLLLTCLCLERQHVIHNLREAQVRKHSVGKGHSGCNKLGCRRHTRIARNLMERIGDVGGCSATECA